MVNIMKNASYSWLIVQKIQNNNKQIEFYKRQEFEIKELYGDEVSFIDEIKALVNENSKLMNEYINEDFRRYE